MATAFSHPQDLLHESAGDDWIFKIDTQGEVEWHYFANNKSGPTAHSIVELDDGSILAVGGVKWENKALVKKLNASGQYQWSVNRVAPGIDHDYKFISAVQVQDKVYLADDLSATSGLFTISAATGEISQEPNIPDIQGHSSSIEKLIKNKANNLTVIGFAYPETSDPNRDYFDGGAYVQIFDSKLNSVMTWHNALDYLHANISYATQFENGNYGIIGQSGDGSPAVSVVSPEGRGLINGLVNKGIYYYESRALVYNEENGMYTTVTNINNAQNLVEFSPSLKSHEQKLINEVNYPDSHRVMGLIGNPDNTVTVLQRESYEGKYRIIIKKMAQ
ncbi:hypothetical protein [Pseudoalteromonas luteoviolacea]|uniref:hypothetical protein n=1 Tax=Pseudoalteromonas luteoviolacea TaxID=43657 RepID=UPI0007B0A2BB|nr:hypothetical protein [Pseudoalteromonas luteoviolacea]